MINWVIPEKQMRKIRRQDIKEAIDSLNTLIEEEREVLKNGKLRAIKHILERELDYV
jgi:hypothetical protein